MNGENCYDVRRGRLIITPDGSVKEEEDSVLYLALVLATTDLTRLPSKEHLRWQ